MRHTLPFNPSSSARACMAFTQKSMCSSSGIPSSCAPSTISWRFTERAKALSFIFFFTEATSTSDRNGLHAEVDVLVERDPQLLRAIDNFLAVHGAREGFVLHLLFHRGHVHFRSQERR